MCSKPPMVLSVGELEQPLAMQHRAPSESDLTSKRALWLSNDLHARGATRTASASKRVIHAGLPTLAPVNNFVSSSVIGEEKQATMLPSRPPKPQGDASTATRNSTDGGCAINSRTRELRCLDRKAWIHKRASLNPQV